MIPYPNDTSRTENGTAPAAAYLERMTHPPDSIEWLHADAPRGNYRAAVFDFDGTLSLLREGWSRLMAEIGLDYLGSAATAEYLEREMLLLSGKPSIFQMRRLAEIIAERSGRIADPDAMLAIFLERLIALSASRQQRITDAIDVPAAWTVPGTFAILENLRRRGVTLLLASGTDLAFVRRECDILGLTEFFGERIHGPADNTPNFSKRTVIEHFLNELGIDGASLLGFGDGYSETVEIKRAGGTMIGVASHEAGIPGINRMKREMLVELGADAIVPDYADGERLIQWLFRV